MSPSPFSLLMLPSLVLILWIGYELVRYGSRPYLRTGGRTALHLLGWALRPWAVWAAVNALFRWQAARGNSFNNPLTFPFFANPWREGLPLRQVLGELIAKPTLWLWGTVTLLLLAALLGVILLGLRQAAGSRRATWSALAAMVVLAIGLDFSIACLPDGARLDEEYRGSLLSCWSAHATMLYAVPHIQSSRHYLTHFLEIQPGLRGTVHGLSHPPGASLAMYWIGQVMGVGGGDIRRDAVRLRYAIGLTCFSALSILLLYALASALFDDRRTGLLAAALWLAAPSVLAYSTFAQDGLYAVFFMASLLCTWKSAMAPRHHWPWMLLQGLLFFALTMLNYSWCLMTTIFALFTLCRARQCSWSRRELAWRGIPPLALMTLLTGGLLLACRLDYWAMYRCSSAYVAKWYNYANGYQSLIALIGGQIDLFLLMGSITCSAFAVGLWGTRRELTHPRSLLLGLVLSILALPILFGPPCLRLETARCWNWATAIPFAFAADVLLRQSAPRTYAACAVALSVLTYTGLRLFVNFAP